MTTNVGAVAPLDLKYITRLQELGCKSVQFFLQDEGDKKLSYKKLLKRAEGLKLTLPSDMTFAVHAPFWYNLVKGDWLTDKTVDDLYCQLEVCERLGVRYYVVHPGWLSSQKDRDKGIRPVTSEKATENLCAALAPFKEALTQARIQVLLENTPGSENGMMAGGLKFLKAIVDEMSPTVAICLDTQHAWARGESIYKLDEAHPREKFIATFIRQYVRMVHLNGCPAKLEFGSFVDRHSVTPITESPKRLKVILKQVIKACVNRDIPMILERDSGSVIREDLDFLRGMEVL